MKTGLPGQISVLWFPPLRLPARAVATTWSKHWRALGGWERLPTHPCKVNCRNKGQGHTKSETALEDTRHLSSAGNTSTHHREDTSSKSQPRPQLQLPDRPSKRLLQKLLSPRVSCLLPFYCTSQCFCFVLLLRCTRVCTCLHVCVETGQS